MKHIFSFFANDARVNGYTDLTVGQAHIAFCVIAIIAIVMIVSFSKIKEEYSSN
jgi:hypothetical protein